MKKHLPYIVQILLFIAMISTVSCDNIEKNKLKLESVEIVKIVFHDGNSDTLKLKDPIRMRYDDLYSEDSKVATNVKYFKRLN